MKKAVYLYILNFDYINPDMALDIDLDNQIKSVNYFKVIWIYIQIIQQEIAAVCSWLVS